MTKDQIRSIIRMIFYSVEDGSQITPMTLDLLVDALWDGQS